MSQLTNYLLREVHESQQKAMNALLEAWDRQIQAHQEALIKLNQQKKQQSARDAALSQAIASYLQGLVSQAESGDDVTVAIPTGIQVASPIIGGPSMSMLNTLIAEIGVTDEEHDPAQRSAAWAMKNGFVPHPADLTKILHQVEVDKPWAERLLELSKKLQTLDDQSFGSSQLKLHAGGQRLDVVEQEIALLKEYSPERTIMLVGNPIQLKKDRAPPRGPSVVSAKQEALNRILDDWL